jgi:hypothetical protein
MNHYERIHPLYVIVMRVINLLENISHIPPCLVSKDIHCSFILLFPFHRFGSCQHYTGEVCSKYLDPNRLVYYDEPPSAVEKRLSGPLTVIQGRFKSHCKKFALPALCLYSFPYCEAKPHPQPVRLCKDDCDQLYEGVCNHDFNLAKRVALKYPPLLKIIPDCANLTTLTKEGDDCVKLGLDEGM